MVVELAPQTTHQRIDVPVILRAIVSVHEAGDSVPRVDAPGTLHQSGQQIELLRGKVDDRARLVDDMSAAGQQDQASPKSCGPR